MTRLLLFWCWVIGAMYAVAWLWFTLTTPLVETTLQHWVAPYSNDPLFLCALVNFMVGMIGPLFIFHVAAKVYDALTEAGFFG